MPALSSATPAYSPLPFNKQRQLKELRLERFQMTKSNRPKSPSSLLRKQVGNISRRMQDITDEAAASPLQDMDELNKVSADFDQVEKEVYANCTKMDESQSVAGIEKATSAAYILTGDLVKLKNEARSLVENDVIAKNLVMRFGEQLERVERIMNESMRPFLHSPAMSEEHKNQAIETLERWSEVYRHGIKATGDITVLGEDWLKEAHQRLDLTAKALQKLDADAAIAKTIPSN